MNKLITMLSLLFVLVLVILSQLSPPYTAAVSPNGNLNHDPTVQSLDQKHEPYLHTHNHALTIQSNCIFLPLVLMAASESSVGGEISQVSFNCPPAILAIDHTSPRSGEDGVAVSRETIVNFNGPLDPTTLSPTAIHATVDDIPIDTYLHLSPDNRRVTLFYPTYLPGNKEILVTIDGDQLKDIKGNAVDADGDGETGGIAVIKFETVNVQPTPGTVVCGRIVASEVSTTDNNEPIDTPLAGVTITVDGSDTLQAITDATGNFCLDPAPAGRFFVHIDGRTATNQLAAEAYYPMVGKAWEAEAGQLTNLRTIYLPLIVPDTLQAVSSSQNTTINFPQSVQTNFPEFANTTVMVPADSLFADDGSRGGAVGIAPVAPSRLPGELPGALTFPIVITVQTDGATNFDIPASACFPNLRDPETGEVPAAGSQSALWSFNHDTGRFEVIGSMTVSEDGTLVCTDPGVGIPAPGWHGSNANTNGEGPFSVPIEPQVPPGSVCPSFSPSLDDSANVINACLNIFFPNSDVTKDLLGTIGEAKEVQANLEQLIKDLESGGGVNGLNTKIQLLEKTKEELKAAVESIGGPILPLEKLQDGLACADSFLQATGNSCQEITSADSGCFSNATVFACNTASGVKDALSFVNNGISNINSVVNNLAFDAICSITDEIIRQAQGRTQDPSFVVDDEFIQLLKDLRDEYAVLDTVSYAELTATSKIIDDLASFSAAIGDSYVTREGPAPRAYLLLEYGEDTQQRTRANDAGNYRFVLPANTPFNLYQFDPTNELCGSYLGVSAAVGEPTTFHGPVMGQCPAVDSDDDNLSDLAEKIIGTDPNIPDTDGDGSPDGTEIEQGTDPFGLDIEIGDVIMGEISTATEIDRYSFTAQGGQAIYFDVQATGTASCDLKTILTDSNGDTVFSRSCLLDSGPHTLDVGGSYTLLVESDDNTVGTYQFQIWDVPPPDTFAINIGDTISTTNPGNGSGNIETPGVRDVYTFTASPNQMIFFDHQGSSADPLDVHWFLKDGSNNTIVNRGNILDQGPITLSLGGTYTLTVYGEGDAVSTYQFQLWDVPPPDTFAINIGDIISTNNPGNGSGNIETPGVRDVYTFTASPNQMIFFEGQGTSADSLDVHWFLKDESGDTIVNRGNLLDHGPITLSLGGTYTLTVYAEKDTVSTYQFKLWDVPPPDTFTINIGDTVSPNNPGNGSGNIETPGVRDVYTFTVNPNQMIFFDGQGASADPLDVHWFLKDENDNTIVDRANILDHGPITLSLGGTYTLTVYGEGDTVSTYQFQLIQQ